jgi:hypothetical protein
MSYSYTSGLNVGIEIEYPQTPTGGRPMVSGGEKSDDLYHRISEDNPHRGRHTFDGTVGLETVSNVLPIEDAVDWYRNTLRFIADRGGTFNPTSILTRSNNGNEISGTAGLHIHISSLTDSEARALYELSLLPDVQLMACSGVIEQEAPDYRVFRNSWCRMDFDSGREAVVNRRRDGHYEWRLPEPQSRSHFNNLMEFLDTLKSQGKDAAASFARQVVENGDTTSVSRAKEIGAEIEVEEEKASWNAVRSPRPVTGRFFDEMMGDSSAPYIYMVSANDRSEAIGCGEYYGFYTNHNGEATFSARDRFIEVDGDTHLHADSLEPVEDEEVQHMIDRAVKEQHVENQSGKTKKRLAEVL